ncbi:hypothetical protein [Paenibacillus alkalitolerans]|uniref:hypothetical protein n=1 Tax=Paenibacillus alkalitolerans TaxID=2799335 RepID=UPI0018F3978C|nr:hypothetical protein [Paenibacillus alkalitolerans]
MSDFKLRFENSEVELLELMIEALDGLEIEGRSSSCFRILSKLLDGELEVNQIATKDLNQMKEDIRFYVETVEGIFQPDIGIKLLKILEQ